MALDPKLIDYMQRLPESYQEELLDFIRYLLLKAERRELAEWSDLSLESAMRGMEEEETLYDTADLKVVFK
ncbi:MAG: hypothetical protein KatS3mg022_0099 [Armatimonadota bacterium]|nr:MAG: hypothetical protein KatS3mg022_0099 [Armatimonadota bacterium]